MALHLQGDFISKCSHFILEYLYITACTFSIPFKVPRSYVSKGKTLSIQKKKKKWLRTDKSQECAYGMRESYCGCHRPDPLLVETGPTSLDIRRATLACVRS